MWILIPLRLARPLQILPHQILRLLRIFLPHPRQTLHHQTRLSLPLQDILLHQAQVWHLPFEV